MICPKSGTDYPVQADWLLPTLAFKTIDFYRDKDYSCYKLYLHIQY